MCFVCVGVLVFVCVSQMIRLMVALLTDLACRVGTPGIVAPPMQRRRLHGLSDKWRCGQCYHFQQKTRGRRGRERERKKKKKECVRGQHRHRPFSEHIQTSKFLLRGLGVGVWGYVFWNVLAGT